jgi:hypothetical protein
MLREMIARVRDELIQAEGDRKAKTDEEFFRVDSVVLEVNFVVTESTKGGGGIDFKVLSASGSKKYEQQQVHKVTVTLTGPDTKWANPRNILLWNRNEEANERGA